MAFRVVARTIPPEYRELDKDVTVSTISNSDDAFHPTEVRFRTFETKKRDLRSNSEMCMTIQ